jgi:hypothetical protein
MKQPGPIRLSRFDCEVEMKEVAPMSPLAVTREAAPVAA